MLKARAAGALSKIDALYGAIDRYRLATGSVPNFGTAYPTQQQMNDVLDIDITLDQNMSYVYYGWAYIGIRYSSPEALFHIYKGLGGNDLQWKDGQTSCWAYKDTSKSSVGGRSVCESFCGTLNTTDDPTADYCVLK